MAGNAEPEPCAWLLPARAQLHKQVEDPRMVLGGDPDSGVLHLERQKDPPGRIGSLCSLTET